MDTFEYNQLHNKVNSSFFEVIIFKIMESIKLGIQMN